MATEQSFTKAILRQARYGQVPWGDFCMFITVYCCYDYHYIYDYIYHYILNYIAITIYIHIYEGHCI